MALAVLAADARSKINASSWLTSNPVWFRAGRFVCFMTKKSPDEITPADVSNAAISRHLAFCQTTRGVAFSNQVLSERPDPDVIPGKSGAEK